MSRETIDKLWPMISGGGVALVFVLGFAWNNGSHEKEQDMKIKQNSENNTKTYLNIEGHKKVDTELGIKILERLMRIETILKIKLESNDK